ncbi:SDR family oxidoreductase [Longimicrobium sp.]|uniref:SDR family oxidoreductase n=1 Tax=Longimicrobium sp. TaxID=2029185 RepID=UPI002B742BAF|nr:SDR family oxidoreductase [Longimicrobium sp.]HSU14444.1 SDR family oxidoreductase [Longimicrobium sp.]
MAENGSSGEKVVVITGASGGIGAAVARELGRRGHALVLAARNEDALRAVAAEAGGRVHVVRADVTKRADVERLRDEALAAFGRVDVWINNAGRGINRSVHELTDDDIDEMIAVNVKGPVYGAQAILPHFQERGTGHLINISSFLGRVPVATNRSVYSAAKAALNSLTANLRVDLAKSFPGIHVSTVMPGIVSTDFATNALGAGSGPPGIRPTGPMAPQTAEEVATQIADLVDAPKPELYTNPAHPAIARAYYADVGAFEEQAARGFAPPPQPQPAADA